MTRVAINGFGRIGRTVLKKLLLNKNLTIVGINDLTDPKTLAHLFKYDSIHGKFDGTVTSAEKAIIINNQTIPVYAEKDPAMLPWKDLQVDVVIESTGRFTKAELAEAHIKAAARALRKSLCGASCIF